MGLRLRHGSPAEYEDSAAGVLTYLVYTALAQMIGSGAAAACRLGTRSLVWLALTVWLGSSS